MVGVKVKKVKVQLGGDDEGFTEMFNQMLGTGNININMAYPRYLRIENICASLIKLFGMVAKSPSMTAPIWATQRAEIETFCTKSAASMVELFNMKIDDATLNLNGVPDEQNKEFQAAYEKVKKSDLVSTFIIMCDKLVKYKKNFTNLDKLDHRFVYAMPGIEWCPFPFTSLNIKHIFSLMSHDVNTIRFFMTVVGKAFEWSYKLYEETQTPDIDVDQFVDVIMVNLEKIQKQPELHRCRRAFQKIKESVELLKTKFGGYYRDFIATKDSTIMMQHFILDVSKETTADPTITAEFRRIIMYYRKIASSQIKDPKIQQLFNTINNSFNAMDANTKNLKKGEEAVDALDAAESSGSNADEESDAGPSMVMDVGAKTQADL